MMREQSWADLTLVIWHMEQRAWGVSVLQILLAREVLPVIGR